MTKWVLNWIYLKALSMLFSYKDMIFFLLMKATHTQGKYRRDDLSVVNGSSRLRQKSPEATCLSNGSIQWMSCKHVSRQIEVMLEWFPMILVSSTSMWGGYGHCLVWFMAVIISGTRGVVGWGGCGSSHLPSWSLLISCWSLFCWCVSVAGVGT